MTDLNALACPVKFRAINTFYKYYSGEKVAPVTTIFIGGNHEASNHLTELCVAVVVVAVACLLLCPSSEMRCANPLTLALRARNHTTTGTTVAGWHPTSTSWACRAWSTSAACG
jgi:hypothetical protein